MLALLAQETFHHFGLVQNLGSDPTSATFQLHVTLGLPKQQALHL